MALSYSYYQLTDFLAVLMTVVYQNTSKIGACGDACGTGSKSRTPQHSGFSYSNGRVDTTVPAVISSSSPDEVVNLDDVRVAVQQGNLQKIEKILCLGRSV